MIVGINALNLSSGGGITHILSLLSSACPERDNFKKIIIWGQTSLLTRIPDRPWLVKIYRQEADMSLLHRVIWQAWQFRIDLKRNCCDVLFVPGGSDLSGFRPIVGMSQNMLPFEYKEIRRYGLSLSTVKFLLLRIIQSIHLKSADGVIFLSQYAKKAIMEIVSIRGKVRVIPHGINPIFKCKPYINDFNRKFLYQNEIRLLYISNIECYKHQWNVVEAISLLRDEGFLLSLDLIGAPMRGVSRLNCAIKKYDPNCSFIRFHGEVNHESLSAALANSDIFIFASSCENLPITLLEAMSSGIPIACSNMGPMPEVLGDAGIYFNPLDITSIASVVRVLCISEETRTAIAQKAIVKSHGYTWEECTKNTFKFLSEVVSESRNKN